MKIGDTVWTAGNVKDPNVYSWILMYIDKTKGQIRRPNEKGNIYTIKAGALLSSEQEALELTLKVLKRRMFELVVERSSVSETYQECLAKLEKVKGEIKND